MVAGPSPPPAHTTILVARALAAVSAPTSLLEQACPAGAFALLTSLVVGVVGDTPGAGAEVYALQAGGAYAVQGGGDRGSSCSSSTSSSYTTSSSTSTSNSSNSNSNSNSTTNSNSNSSSTSPLPLPLSLVDVPRIASIVRNNAFEGEFLRSAR
jgi:hypothetical protein